MKQTNIKALTMFKLAKEIRKGKDWRIGGQDKTGGGGRHHPFKGPQVF